MLVKQHCHLLRSEQNYLRGIGHNAESAAPEKRQSLYSTMASPSNHSTLTGTCICATALAESPQYYV